MTKWNYVIVQTYRDPRDLPFIFPAEISHLVFLSHLGKIILYRLVVSCGSFDEMDTRHYEHGSPSLPLAGVGDPLRMERDKALIDTFHMTGGKIG